MSRKSEALSGLTIFTSTLSIILEQPALDGTQKFLTVRSYYSVSFLLTGWTLGTFLISNTFKDDLASVITTPSNHWTPSTYAEILAENTTTITTTYHTFEGTYYSTLKDSVLHDLVVDDSSRSKFHAKFEKHLHFYDGSIHSLLKSIHAGVLLVPRGSGKELLLLPDSFAIVDSKTNSEPIRILLRQSSGHYVEKKNEEQNPYGEIFPWLGKRNYFALQIFGKGLASLVESGVHGKWVEQLSKYLVLKRLQFFMDMNAAENGRIPLSTNLYGMVISGRFDAIAGCQNGFSPVTLENVVALFLFGGGMFVAWGLVLLLEIRTICKNRLKIVKTKEM